MFVIELFLPVEGSDGAPMPPATFERIKQELTERFGGVTAFVQAPAEGVWKAPSERTVHDRVAVFEVMVETIDQDWWRRYRARLEQEFNQEEILARAYQVTKL